MDRYARQMAVAGVGEAGQDALRSAHVLVVGAGGLGSTVLPMLVGAGIGRIDIVDPDVVEESNLHRQTLYRMDDIGRPKAEAAATSLHRLNPECIIRTRVVRLDPGNAPDLVRTADVVIDAADMFAATYALSDLCHDLGKPLIAASVTGRSGYVGGFCGGAPSYRALFPDLPRSLQSCAVQGVLGPVVAMLGALQAEMCLDLLFGHDPSPLGRLVSVDVEAWHFSHFRFDGASEPASALPVVLSAAQLAAHDAVFDLRDETEAPMLAPGVQRVTDLDALTPIGEARMVFVCRSGLRAWHAAKAMQAKGQASVAIIADAG